MSRFLACGDFHLGAGPDLGLTPGDRLREQEALWQTILETAVEYDVDAILFAGDAFHRARPTPDELLAFQRPLKRFPRYHGEGTIAILGNHDFGGVESGTGLEVFHVAGMLRLARSPEIREVAGVSVCCLPWVPVSRLVASRNGGDRDDVNEQAAELLIAAARGLRERAEGPAILLTHFSISGAALPNGLPVDQLREPVLEWSALDELGFDAVVGGHIHAPQVFGRDATAGFYVGSPMPLNFGEAGTDHGVWLLERDSLSGAYAPRFVPLESRRLETLDFDGETDPATEPPYEIAEASVMGSVIRARVRLTAEHARRFDGVAFRRSIETAGAHKAFVQVDVAKAERARVEGLTEELGEMEALSLWLAEQGINGSRETELRERTERYLEVVR